MRKLISVVDDDESVRESLPDLLRTFGLEVEAFSSAKDFLESDCLALTSCLILDVAMPGMNGLELQEELIRRRREIPIIFITARVDERLGPLVLKSGAVACLLKPFSEATLLEAVRTAIRAEGA